MRLPSITRRDPAPTVRTLTIVIWHGEPPARGIVLFVISSWLPESKVISVMESVPWITLSTSARVAAVRGRSVTRFKQKDEYVPENVNALSSSVASCRETRTVSDAPRRLICPSST